MTLVNVTYLLSGFALGGSFATVVFAWRRRPGTPSSLHSKTPGQR